MIEQTQEQQRAIAARGDVLVAAGAGTGKTRTISTRCVELVSRERVSLGNVLMVTFTEAAAAEMRERIRSELSACHANNPDKHLAEQIALLHTAPISTLHSFCLNLVRRNFHALDLDPQFTVLDEHQTEPLIHSVLNELFERHYASSNSSNIRELVRCYGNGRDDSIRRLVVSIHRHTQARVSPTSWFRGQTAVFGSSSAAAWRTVFVDGVTQWVELWREALTSIAAESSNIAACLDALASIPASGATFKDIATMLERIVAADSVEWRLGSKTRIRNPIQSFFDDAGFLNELAFNDGAPLEQDWSWVRHHMLALLELAQQFTAAFSKAKQELGGIDFADQEQLALRLLYDKNDKLTQVARACREQFRYVFVDECQDINEAQDAILRAVSGEGPDANRFLVGDVKQSIYRFRLANPKILQRYQKEWSSGSIKDLAAPLRSQRTNGKTLRDGGQVFPLTENFRSREALLQFVNALFRTVMQPIIGQLSYEADAELQFGDRTNRVELSLAANLPEHQIKPRVQLHVVSRESSAKGDDNGASTDGRFDELAELQSTECEARLVAQQLKRLMHDNHQVWDANERTLRSVKWGDMVVLMRGVAGRAEIFAKEFHQAGIPIDAERAGFLKAVEVTDLLNLLRLLDNPLQDVPLLAVLRSPLVGVSPDELVNIRLARRDGPLWTSLVRNAKSDARNPKLELFLAQFTRWHELIRHSSLTHCLETAVEETHYEALLLAGKRGRAQVANVRRLIDMARRFDPYQREGLFRFLQFIAEQEKSEVRHEPAPLAQENAVRLMTIHAAKGREFPVVVLAGLGCRFNLRDLSGDVLINEDLGLCPKVVPPESRNRYPSIAHWVASEREQRELLGEEMRLLYVALTRAKDTLILTAAAPKKDEAARWRELETLTDFALVKASCCLDWLRLWFVQHARPGEWTDECKGSNGLLTWEFHDRDSKVFAVIATSDASLETEPEIPNVGEIRSLKTLLTWRYQHGVATFEPAKTSVSALRRRAMEADDVAATIFEFQREAHRAKTRSAVTTKLSAAGIGIAHHTFMQFVSLDRVSSEPDLMKEAKRMQAAGTLTQDEFAALDFDALASFWQSDPGRRLREKPNETIHREMPFTARMTAKDLRSLKIPLMESDLDDDEFIVVQGFVDLAVLLPQEIWLLDFKTDDISVADLTAKTKLYEPQLKLYAMALKKIYGRDVTHCWLHFLSCRKTVSIAT